MPSAFRSELRAFGGALRRGDPLAWAGLAGVAVLVAFPVYWALASVRPLWAGSAGNAGDFRFYFDAGQRLLADPLTLYDEQAFIYPPPTGALFAVVAQIPLRIGYLMMAVLNVGLMALCVRLGEAFLTDPPRGWARAALWTTALGCAPALQNIKFGQVTPLVLLSALLFLRWLPDRPARAGAVLALGVWLKVYPIVLGVFALRRQSLPVIAGGLAVALAVPLAVWAWVPPALYAEYFGEVLPRLGGLTVPTTLNGGLPAVVQRWSHPAERLLHYSAEPMTAAAAWTARLTLLAGLATAVWTWAKGWPTAWAGLLALAALPVSSSVAWDYTFLLAMPMALAALLTARRGSLAVRVAAGLAALTLFVQKPPEPLVAWMVASAPRWTLDVLSARLLIALAVLAGCALAVRRRERSVPPAVV